MSRSTVWLLDANVLIALTQAAHVHHAEANRWFHARAKRRWATCALTQLAFVRLTSNPRVVGHEINPTQAAEVLATMTAQPGHEYWPDSPEPSSLGTFQSAAVVGHRQVTDAYLLGLAAHKKQRLATLDRGLFTFAQATDTAGYLELVDSRLTVQEPATDYAAKRARR